MMMLLHAASGGGEINLEIGRKTYSEQRSVLGDEVGELNSGNNGASCHSEIVLTQFFKKKNGVLSHRFYS